MCGKKPGWASLGLLPSLWQGEAGVPALVPLICSDCCGIRSFARRGHVEKGCTFGLLLLPAGILDLRLNCSGMCLLPDLRRAWCPGAGLGHLLLLHTRRPNLYKCGLGPLPSKQKESELGPQSGPTRVFKTQSPATHQCTSP